MRKYILLISILFAFNGTSVAAVKSQPVVPAFILLDDSVLTENTSSGNELQRPHPILKALREPVKKNKKLACAIMAFPFPFGIVGLHRIYMGTSPYVPVVYIASLGGVFGILPLIDFIVILSKPNPEEFFGNRKVFMW